MKNYNKKIIIQFNNIIKFRNNFKFFSKIKNNFNNLNSLKNNSKK